MKEPNHIPSPSTRNQPVERSRLSLYLALIAPLLAILACNMEPAQAPANTPRMANTNTSAFTGEIASPSVPVTFTPFSEKDCTSHGLPAPSATNVQDASLSCTYSTATSLNRSITITITYYAQLQDTKSAFATQYSNLFSNYNNYELLNNQDNLLQMFASVPDLKYSNPTNDFVSVEIYHDHFLIQTKGELVNTIMDDAQTTFLDFISDGELIADDHS